MISVSNLSKNYNQQQALNGINLEIKQGEFFGLLGPNGAGKTTTISILSTILTPSEGVVKIDGLDIAKNATDCKRKIGVVPQEIALYNELTAYQNLLFWGSLYDVPKSELKIRIEEILRLFGLWDRKDDKVKAYSGGMKRRINIASALLHKPKVLFLDEPTVGIDPQSRNLIYEVIEKLHAEGMTMVYTTHYMEEAERFCDRIGIIDNGQIIAQGTLEELKNSVAIKETIIASFTNLTDEMYQLILVTNGEVKRFENSLHFFSHQAKNDLSKIIIQCNDIGLEITQIEIQKVNLETIFLNLTGKQLRD